MKKRIISILLSVILLLSLTACGSADYEKKHKSFKAQSSVSPANSVFAQNERFTLEYDETTGGITITENATGLKWATCPTTLDTSEPELNDLGMPIKPHGYPQSVLDVTFTDAAIRGGGEQSTYSYDSVMFGGSVVCKEIENGLTIEYYFNSQEFMIPVNFVLHDDYVSVSVDTKNIMENEKYSIVALSLAPFLCSAKNDTEDAYLFMPSGSGALIGVDSYNAQGLYYGTRVYGEDLIMEEKYDATDEKSVRLPVYGYKNGNVGGLAIIDKGADAATIKSNSGSTVYKFSSVYPTFETRGYTMHETASFNHKKDIPIYSENMLDSEFSIRFYPLSGENANYTGMANTYRDYLIKEQGLTEKGDEKALNINFIGGTEIVKSMLGIPYTTVFPTTTVEQAKEITSEISNGITKDLSVNLKGFGTTGIDYGKIAGGFKINGNLGSVSDIKKLAASLAESKIDLYMDFDVVNYSESGGGFSYFGDASMHTGRIKADQYVFDKAIRSNDENFRYRLLRPSSFEDAVSKTVDKTNGWNLSGVSLASLTSLSYSDYTEQTSTKYNSKLGFGDTVSKSLDLVKKGNKKVVSTDANVYAALKSDVILDAPVFSANGYAFIEDVPFYSMVFKGYIPMTTESINISDQPDRALLAAVEGGLALNYTLISQWDNKLIDANVPYFSSSVYAGVKEDIASAYGDLSSFYEKIDGAKIVSNTVISSGVHSTVFDNGVTVYVNYNTNAVQTPAGEIGALDYAVLEGAA